tara:strand:- start:365 stop:877 length:513 start_codon:yes stop_codon:yes gene_type:complete
MSLTNIVLIGLMGAGKSAVGYHLAQHVKFKFVDTDKLITSQSGKTIPDLFDISEAYFRSWELTVCKGLANKSQTIIATGGGVVTQKQVMSLLSKLGHIVYLKATVDTLYQRLKHHGDRPLLNTADPLKALQLIYDKRKTLYESYADLIIEVDQLSVMEISDTIVNTYDIF